MFYHTEAKPQGWRSLAVFADRSERLLYLARSTTQVRAGYAEVTPWGRWEYWSAPAFLLTARGRRS